MTPLGVLAAFYLREYARQGAFVSAVRIAVNNLAGVPSIVFGVFGVGLLHLLRRRHDRPALLLRGAAHADLRHRRHPVGLADAGAADVPVVIVATEEGLAAVPRGMREASLALRRHQAGDDAARRAARGRCRHPHRADPRHGARGRRGGAADDHGVVKLAPALPIDGFWPFLHLDRKFMHLGFHIYDVGFQSPNVDAARPMVFATTLLLLADRRAA